MTPDELRSHRRVLNASQAILAARMGVSVQTVRAWEQGINPIPEWAARFVALLASIDEKCIDSGGEIR